MELVELKKGNVYCDTGVIARKFGMQHAKVVQAMETLIPKLDDFRVTGFHPYFEKEEREYRGTKYNAYLLNRDCFILLGMRFDTKLARRWQGQFIAAFNSLEQRILSADTNATDPTWLTHREQGRVARIEETDVIKKFVAYATEQGSKSAQFYYKHITTATYKALGLMYQRKPKLRDSMNLYEIAELLLAERIAKNSLDKYMKLGRHYKDIYESVKDDLMMFCNGLHLE
jgi:Rha family phage regulatory protein